MRWFFRSLGASLFNLSILAAALLVFLFYSAFSPLPSEWNPFSAFNPADPVNILTRFKLQALEDNEQACQTALAALNVTFQKRADFTAPENQSCGIQTRTLVTDINGSGIGPIETQCHVVLRTALWARDFAQPAARAYFGASITTIETQGSYNCRPIRTDAGNGQRMSEHATANAVDIKGVTLSSGKAILLSDHWDNGGPEGAFLRELRDGGCLLFEATLGPEFNRAHADHFHFDNGRFRVCR